MEHCKQEYTRGAQVKFVQPGRGHRGYAPHRQARLSAPGELVIDPAIRGKCLVITRYDTQGHETVEVVDEAMI